MSDLSRMTRLNFPEFSENGHRSLSIFLGDKVDIANPLDYHTYIWGDVPVMTDVFSAVMNEALDLSLFVLDIPRADQCDPSGHDCAIEAIIAAKAITGAKAAVIGSLSENLEEDVIGRFIKGGIIPLLDMQVALRVVDILSSPKPREINPIIMTEISGASTQTLSEYDAKQKLSKFGIVVPQGELVTAGSLPKTLTYPIAAKVSGLAHKSETGGVILGIKNEAQAISAIQKLTKLSENVLLEDMITEPFIELIIGN